MLIIFEAADLNLDFLSVRILCSTFARTDSQETLLVLDLELQSCNNVAAVQSVFTTQSGRSFLSLAPARCLLQDNFTHKLWTGKCF